MRSLREAEEALGRWDKKNWQHPPGNPTAYHTTLHLVKAIFRAMAKAQRSSPPSPHVHHTYFFRQFFDEISGRLIEHSLRLCRTFGKSAVDVLLIDPGGDNIATIDDWANHHGEAAADSFEDTFVGLMDALVVLVDLQERQGHGGAVDWSAALSTVPALMKGALGASVNFYEGQSRFIPPIRERLVELANQNEYASVRA